MPDSRDRAEFGKAVKDARKQKGLLQQDIVDRVSGHYGDVSSYRRIENGGRFPLRDAAIAIVVHGLRITEVASINTFLSLAGYEALSSGERADLGLSIDATGLSPVVLPQPPVAQTEKRPRFPRGVRWATAAVVISTGLSAVLCFKSEYGTTVGLILSAMYAALYVVSLLLESAYERQTRSLWSLTVVFCLMLISSSAAIAVDKIEVNSAGGYGLTFALMIFAAGATFQAAVSQRVLPNYPVVKARFLVHTAQSAHLKNTCYFLLIVVLFWLPPLHAVTVLRHELQLGHATVIREITKRWIFLGHGVMSLNYGWLLGVLAIIAIISLPMRTRLLDNLRPHPHQNQYLNLFYLRTLLYFSLTGTCFLWYAYAIGELLDQVN